MRILVLQTTKLNFAHRSFTECLKRVHDVTFYGAGFVEDYNSNISIFKILEKYPKFDFILSNAKGYFIRDLHEISNIPKVVIVADYFGWRQNTVNQWLHLNKYDLAFVFNEHWTKVELGKKKLVPKIFVIPPGADGFFFKQMNLPRTIDVMSTASQSTNFYPFRASINQTLRGMQDIKTQIEKLPPKKYAEYLNKSKIFLHGADRVGGVSFKCFEAMACGTLLLTHWVPGMVTYGLIAGKHFAAFNGPEDIEEKIYYWLKHEEQRQKLAEAGRRYTLRNFTNQKIIKYFMKIIQRELL